MKCPLEASKPPIWGIQGPQTENQPKIVGIKRACGKLLPGFEEQ
jgi:hypothetical protein